MIQLQELFSLHFVIEFLRVLRGERVRFAECSTLETRVLRSTPLAEVLDLAPGVTSKAKKITYTWSAGIGGRVERKVR